MDKGRRAMGKFAVPKPTWEIMKISWEITDFISQLILGTIFKGRTPQKMLWAFDRSSQPYRHAVARRNGWVVFPFNNVRAVGT